MKYVITFNDLKRETVEADDVQLGPHFVVFTKARRDGVYPHDTIAAFRAPMVRHVRVVAEDIATAEKFDPDKIPF